jgi:hypothetical protein
MGSSIEATMNARIDWGYFAAAGDVAAAQLFGSIRSACGYVCNDLKPCCIIYFVNFDDKQPRKIGVSFPSVGRAGSLST